MNFMDIDLSLANFQNPDCPETGRFPSIPAIDLLVHFLSSFEESYYKTLNFLNYPI